MYEDQGWKRASFVKNLFTTMNDPTRDVGPSSPAPQRSPLNPRATAWFPSPVTSPTSPSFASPQSRPSEATVPSSNRGSLAATSTQGQAGGLIRQEVNAPSASTGNTSLRKRIYDAEQHRLYMLTQLHTVNDEIDKIERDIEDEENGRGLGQEGVIEKLLGKCDYRKEVKRYLQDRWTELDSNIQDMMADLGSTKLSQDFDENWINQSTPTDGRNIAASRHGRAHGQDQGVARAASSTGRGQDQGMARAASLTGRGPWRGHSRGRWRSGSFSGQGRGQGRGRRWS